MIRRFSRRTMLKTAGVSLALPFLESVVRPTSARAAEAAPPRRLLCINTTLGLHTENLFPAEAGRDATVAWNYVDLRVRVPITLRLEVKLEDGDLVVRFLGPAGAAKAEATVVLAPTLPPTTARSCGTCDEAACFRHEKHEKVDA